MQVLQEVNFPQASSSWAKRSLMPLSLQSATLLIAWLKQVCALIPAVLTVMCCGGFLCSTSRCAHAKAANSH